jgi:hypothetical protein
MKTGFLVEVSNLRYTTVASHLLNLKWTIRDWPLHWTVVLARLSLTFRRSHPPQQTCLPITSPIRSFKRQRPEKVASSMNQPHMLSYREEQVETRYVPPLTMSVTCCLFRTMVVLLARLSGSWADPPLVYSISTAFKSLRVSDLVLLR